MLNSFSCKRIVRIGEAKKMSIPRLFGLLLLMVIVLSVLVVGDETTTPQMTTTAQGTTIAQGQEHELELQTEESRVLKKPENSTRPLNHSETLRAMPTEQTKTFHSTHVEVQSQTQTQSERVVKASPAPSSVLNISAATDVGRYKDFRPSPQLETIYEYNRFPVEPAHPEAKFFQTSLKIPVHTTLGHVLDDNAEEEEKDVWTSKVRFPHTHPVTVNDHPYPYMKDSSGGGTGLDKGAASGYGGYGGVTGPLFGGYGATGGPAGSGGHHKDVAMGMGMGKRPIMHKYSYGGDGWDKTLKKRPPSKTFHDEGSYHSEPAHTDLSSSPWKKIIKILTAFIPIGLLLSALTPSIITIGPMNGTTARARSGEKPKNILSHLSLDGCDERIFCELMLSADETGNNDKNIETMIENFVQSHGNTARLKLIYKAIKSGNCSSLHCNSIKE